MLIVALIRHNAMSHKQGDVCRNTACHLPTDIQPFLVGELYVGKLLPVRFNAHGCKILCTVNVCNRHSGIGIGVHNYLYFE
jgi:hypothetical protein